MQTNAIIKVNGWSHEVVGGTALDVVVDVIAGHVSAGRVKRDELEFKVCEVGFENNWDMPDKLVALLIKRILEKVVSK